MYLKVQKWWDEEMSLCVVHFDNGVPGGRAASFLFLENIISLKTKTKLAFLINCVSPFQKVTMNI